MVLSEEHLKDWRQMLLRLQHQNLVSNQIEHVRQLQEVEADSAQLTKSFDADTSTPELPSRQLKSVFPPPPPHSLAEENSGADREQAAQMREAEALLDGFTLEACRAVQASGGAIRTGDGRGVGGSRTGSTVGRAGTGSYGGKLDQRVIGGPEVAEGQSCSAGDSESFAFLRKTEEMFKFNV